MKTNNEVFTSMDYAGEDMLINPFFYKKRDDKVISIEDFATTIKLGLFQKKQTVFVHSIVRNSEINTKKRIKLFNDYLRKNKKDFDRDLSQKCKENKENKESVKLIDFKKVPIGKYFLALVLIAVSVFLALLFSKSFVEKLGFEFLKTMNEHMLSHMEIYHYALMIIPGLFSVLYFVYLVVFGARNHKYLKQERVREKAFARYELKARKAIKKCYRRVKKYYKKNIKEGNFNYEALTLDELWDLKVEDNTNQTEFDDKSRKVIKRNKLFKTNNTFFMMVICISLAGLLVYEILSIFR